MNPIDKFTLSCESGLSIYCHDFYQFFSTITYLLTLGPIRVLPKNARFLHKQHVLFFPDCFNLANSMLQCAHRGNHVSYIYYIQYNKESLTVCVLDKYFLTLNKVKKVR